MGSGVGGRGRGRAGGRSAMGLAGAGGLDRGPDDVMGRHSWPAQPRTPPDRVMRPGKQLQRHLQMPWAASSQSRDCAGRRWLPCRPRAPQAAATAHRLPKQRRSKAAQPGQGEATHPGSSPSSHPRHAARPPREICPCSTRVRAEPKQQVYCPSSTYYLYIPRLRGCPLAKSAIASSTPAASPPT